MPKIVDNIGITAETELLASLKESHRLDVAVGYFNLRGWRLLAEAVAEMPRVDGQPKARILVGMTENPSEEMRRQADGVVSPRMDNPRKEKLRVQTVNEFRHQLEVGVPTLEDEKTLRTLKQQIENGEVQVRLHANHRLHAKLYLCHSESTRAPRVGYVGSSNLTQSGLTEKGELSVDVLDVDATKKLNNWFEDRWDDSHPIDLALAEIIKNSWVTGNLVSPYMVYLKMAYHLSEEARKGLVAYGLPATLQGELLGFQEAAVQIAARIITQKGGAMIGDVVGLGKTLVGTATARLLQEEQGYETLVICPKNLVTMWEDYLHRYEIRGTVEPLSMVHKTLVGEQKLGRHRFVIIDEAHNLRSEKRRDYQAIQEYIRDNESKTLLLTATPYNKEFSDLAAQLGLFIPADSDLGLRPQKAIAEIGEREFSKLCGDSTTSSLNAFKRSEHIADWQSLMSQYLIRRTRRFVEDNYSQKDATGRSYLEFGDGGKFFFPQRVPSPIPCEVSDGEATALMIDDTTLDAINRLLLPRYDLGSYLDDSFAPSNASDAKIIDDLRLARGGTLKGFTRVTIFKRLSSSGPAFLSTLRRHRLRNLVSQHALKNGLKYPVGSPDKTLWAVETDVDDEDSGEHRDDLFGLWDIDADVDNVSAQAYNRLEAKNPKAIRWADPAMFDSSLLEDLETDSQAIGGLLHKFGSWDAANDGKMDALVELLQVKHASEKVLVFTEAADTAAYVAKELQHKGIHQVGIVTGDSSDPTLLAKRFSPRSNNVESSDSRVGEELRVLVSTDVLSEGQNLQDAHIVVNYDLPWAIVRLVQRAGRVDRIGQTSDEVLVYSLLPGNSLEEVINLRSRIKKRLGESAQLLGSDEKYFGDATETEFIEGKYDETGERLEEENGSVDPVSQAYEIWRYAKKHYPDIVDQVERLPNIVYSTKQVASEEGVLVHTRSVTGSDEFTIVSADSNSMRSVTPQTALRLAECSPDASALPRLVKHHALVAQARKAVIEGKRSRMSTALWGVRDKVWKRLHEKGRSFNASNLFFTELDLEAALDEMNAHHLQEHAKQKLANALKGRDENLATLLTSLHKEGELCQPPISETAESNLSIICTMGLKHN